MGRSENEDDEGTKEKLVIEICFISAMFSSCAHLCSNARKVFVDWYLILKVDEDSGLDLIRRGYLKLALQLHPDKNKHPKAEVAFKFIQEAYDCLSDKARRQIFNRERKRSFCKECYLTWQSNQHKNHPNMNSYNKDNKKAQPIKRSSIELPTRHKILLKMHQLQKRFRKECQVIESFLKTSTRTTSWKSESPLFDPYDPKRFPNYPYQRRASAGVTAMGPRYCFFQPSNEAWRQVGCELPVYDVRSECWARRTAEPQFSQV